MQPIDGRYQAGWSLAALQVRTGFGGPTLPASPNDHWLPHKDWRVYLGVVLMLIAMFVYLATLDEAVRPDGAVSEPVPAAPGP